MPCEANGRGMLGRRSARSKLAFLASYLVDSFLRFLVLARSTISMGVQWRIWELGRESGESVMRVFERRCRSVSWNGSWS